MYLSPVLKMNFQLKELNTKCYTIDNDVLGILRPKSPRLTFYK